ncbi:hypothetical protein F511_40128 [Dorcoceras hygrometricum]|uniref:Uncharacterized protein n=1 Tax=Dorcoceras hygrometricum TaxID=472368 RepID=A0A2Z7BBI2_9LAMI|nr:hypothetical protein F511_40128 [Dorcoceras hygrometricum]
MKVEHRILHDIVAKSLRAKMGSFDVVTTETFEMMVVINAGMKVNWRHILLQTLVAMVYMPDKKSQGYAVPLSILLEKLVKADLGESVTLHPLKVLNHKSVLTYMKKNQAATQAGETSKLFGDTTGEKKFTADGLQSLTNKMVKEKVVTVKKEKMVVEKKMAQRRQVELVQTQTGSRSSDSESAVSLPLVEIKKKQRMKRPNMVKPIHAVEETTVLKELPLVVRTEPEEPAQQSSAYGTGMVFSPIEIRDIIEQPTFGLR